MIREVREETNISLESIEFFQYGAFTIGDCYIVYLDYIGKCPEHAEIKLNEEFSDWGFFNKEEIASLDLFPETIDVLQKAMRYHLEKNI